MMVHDPARSLVPVSCFKANRSKGHSTTSKFLPWTCTSQLL